MGWLFCLIAAATANPTLFATKHRFPFFHEGADSLHQIV
jgi:hypothetical protein